MTTLQAALRLTVLMTVSSPSTNPLMSDMLCRLLLWKMSMTSPTQKGMSPRSKSRRTLFITASVSEMERTPKALKTTKASDRKAVIVSPIPPGMAKPSAASR